MFPDVKMDAKLIGFGIVAAIILVVAGVLWYQHHEVKNLTQQNAADKTTIAAQGAAASEAATTIKNTGAISGFTDQGAQAIEKKTDNNAAQQAQVAQQTDATVAAIKQKYNQQPKTPQAAVAEDKEVAQAQIDGLWQTFCNTAPDQSSDCQASH
jgi:FtsZ-interacting cell division protein ZipA